MTEKKTKKKKKTQAAEEVKPGISADLLSYLGVSSESDASPALLETAHRALWFKQWATTTDGRMLEELQALRGCRRP